MYQRPGSSEGIAFSTTKRRSRTRKALELLGCPRSQARSRTQPPASGLLCPPTHCRALPAWLGALTECILNPASRPRAWHQGRPLTFRRLTPTSKPVLKADPNLVKADPNLVGRLLKADPQSGPLIHHSGRAASTPRSATPTGSSRPAAPRSARIEGLSIRLSEPHSVIRRGGSCWHYVIKSFITTPTAGPALARQRLTIRNQ